MEPFPVQLSSYDRARGRRATPDERDVGERVSARLRRAAQRAAVIAAAVGSPTALRDPKLTPPLTLREVLLKHGEGVPLTRWANDAERDLRTSRPTLREVLLKHGERVTFPQWAYCAERDLRPLP